MTGAISPGRKKKFFYRVKRKTAKTKNEKKNFFEKFTESNWEKIFTGKNFLKIFFSENARNGPIRKKKR